MTEPNAKCSERDKPGVCGVCSQPLRARETTCGSCGSSAYFATPVCCVGGCSSPVVKVYGDHCAKHCTRPPDNAGERPAAWGRRHESSCGWWNGSECDCLRAPLLARAEVAEADAAMLRSELAEAERLLEQIDAAFWDWHMGHLRQDDERADLAVTRHRERQGARERGGVNDEPR